MPFAVPRLTLSQRVLFAFSIVLLFSVGISIYIIVALQTLATLSKNEARIAVAVETAYTLDIEVLRVILLLEQYRDTRDKKKLVELEANRATATVMRTELRQQSTLPEVIETLDRYEALLPQRIAAANVIVAAIELRARSSQIAYIKDRLNQLDLEAHKLLRRIIAVERQALELAREESLNYATRMRRNVLGLFALNGAIMLALLYSIIAGGLTRRLSQLIEMARRIAVGDFSKLGAVQGHDEVATLARTFNDMAGQLAEFDKVKEEFVALASHQLRTPATAVKGNLGMLLEGYCGELSAEQLEILNDANQSNERQLAVINDMLYVARTEAGRLVLTKSSTDLSKLVDEAAAEQKHSIAARKQMLSVEKLAQPILLHLDTEKMRMVIGNILSNASKYTPDGGTISIVFRPGRKDPDREVAISISDSGVGIEKDDMAKLFSKFSRIANPLSDKVGGTGLGLFLANEIVKLHGGSIFVNSTLGEGSTFTIVIPK